MRVSLTVARRVPPHLIPPGAPPSREQSVLEWRDLEAALAAAGCDLRAHDLLRAGGCVELIIQCAPMEVAG